MKHTAYIHFLQQVVLASGDIVIASATESTDLLWAIRGGCSNFGIIAEMNFKLHVLPNNGNLCSGVRVHLPLGFLGKIRKFYILYLHTHICAASYVLRSSLLGLYSIDQIVI
jgi:hypothetical protein